MTGSSLTGFFYKAEEFALPTWAKFFALRHGFLLFTLMGMSQRGNIERAVLGYLANALLFTLAVVLYRYNGYYVDFLREGTQKFILWAYIAYLIIGLPFTMFFPSGKDSKGLLIINAILRYLASGFRYLFRFPLERENPPTITKEEKNAMLFFVVKFFFLPIMVNFMLQNGIALKNNWANVWTQSGVMQMLLDGWYPLLIALIFFIDTTYFTFGYSVELPILKNQIRSVEPTLFGWFVAIICYPPFNDIPGFYVGWAANDYATFSSLPMTLLLRIAILLCLIVDVWATIALGAKCSNLTNRGIVSRGPYAFIRHPAYISKNLAWWISSIPFLIDSGRVSYVFLSMGIWSVIYFLRALTEERHLIADPDYQEYCRKVKWRFIPYVF